MPSRSTISVLFLIHLVNTPCVLRWRQTVQTSLMSLMLLDFLEKSLRKSQVYGASVNSLFVFPSGVLHRPYTVHLLQSHHYKLGRETRICVNIWRYFCSSVSKNQTYLNHLSRVFLLQAIVIRFMERSGIQRSWPLNGTSLPFHTVP